MLVAEFPWSGCPGTNTERLNKLIDKMMSDRGRFWEGKPWGKDKNQLHVMERMRRQPRAWMG